LPLSEKICQAISEPFLSHLAFPDDQNAPSRFLQGLTMSSIARRVSLQLGLPVREVGERFVNQSASPVPMLMPKASMYENDLSPAGENHVRTARERVPMQAVAISHPVNHAADSEFGTHVLAPVCPHH
jgi:hypothetical protein